MRVRITPDARADLREIWTYLRRENLAASIRYKQRFADAFDLLRRFPRAGRARPELGGAALRSLPVDPYLVLYRVDRDAVSIARVVHGARDLERLMDAEG